MAEPARPSSHATPPPAPRGVRRLSRRQFLGLGAGAAAVVLFGGACASKNETPRPNGVPLSPEPGESLPEPNQEPVEEPILTAPPPGPNRVARENRLPGRDTWMAPFREPPGTTGDVQAYFGHVSAVAGDQVALYARSTAPKTNVFLYRLGWYGGAGARIVARWHDMPLAPQPDATTDPLTGMTRAAWSPALSFSPSDGWVSGLYVALMTPQGGKQQYATLIIREATNDAPILVLSASTSHQAYNNWGGKSLYQVNSVGAPTIGGDARSVMASFDRPYQDYRGGGLQFRWEYNFVRWLEANGYDVGYAADLDLERFPSITQGRRLIVLAGHPEYWTPGMRRTLEAAIAAGTNVAWFSGNEMYWRARLEGSPLGPARTVVCYRDARLDPIALTDPTQVTNHWRDPPDPRPESLVIGQMYGHVVERSADWVCTAPSHWVFAGTGMAARDSITNLVGQEYDRYYPDPGLQPPGTTILSTSPVTPHFASLPVPLGEPTPAVANSTIYTAPSGATVFSAGTIHWSWGLDGWENPNYLGVPTPVDPRAQRITANILDRLGR